MNSLLYSRGIGPKDGSEVHRCLIVHGIMGSSQNWLGAARRLSALSPSWSFRVLDLPGHGQSSSTAQNPDLPSIAQKIFDTLNSESWRPTILVGHSFGGKTMIELSSLYSEAALDVWLLDAPMSSEITVTGLSTIDTILDVVESLPEPTSRTTVQEAFQSAGLPESIAQWMTTNLRRTVEGFTWKIDPRFVRRALKDYLARDYSAYLEDKPEAHRFHCVLAGRTNWWRGAEERRLRRLEGLTLHTLPRAGHWLHIDDLDGLLKCFRVVYDLD